MESTKGEKKNCKNTAKISGKFQRSNGKVPVPVLKIML